MFSFHIISEKVYREETCMAVWETEELHLFHNLKGSLFGPCFFSYLTWTFFTWLRAIRRGVVLLVWGRQTLIAALYFFPVFVECSF